MSCCPTYRPQELVIEAADYLESLVGTIGCSTYRLASATEGARPTVTSTGLIQFSVLSLCDTFQGLGTASSPLCFADGDAETEQTWKWDGDSWGLAPWPTPATFLSLGAGEEVYAGTVGVQAQFKSLVAGTGVTLTSDASTITIDADSVNTFSSLGAGEAIYAGTVADDVQFRSLVAGTNVVLVTGADTVTISAAGSSADLLQKNLVYFDDVNGNDLTGTTGYANRPYTNMNPTNCARDFGDDLTMRFVNTITVNGPGGFSGALMTTADAGGVKLMEGIGVSGFDSPGVHFAYCPAGPITLRNLVFSSNINVLFVLGLTATWYTRSNPTYGTDELSVVFENCVFRGSFASPGAYQLIRADALCSTPGNVINTPISATFLGCEFQVANNTGGVTDTYILSLSDPGASTPANTYGPSSAAAVSGNTVSRFIFSGCTVTTNPDFGYTPAAPVRLVNGPGNCQNTEIHILTPMVAQWSGGGVAGCTGAVVYGIANLLTGDCGAPTRLDF